MQSYDGTWERNPAAFAAATVVATGAAMAASALIDTTVARRQWGVKARPNDEQEPPRGSALGFFVV
jgi:hypothetical protein